MGRVTGPRRRAVFLDRDGVINETVRDPRNGEHPESPLRPQDVALVAGAAAALRRLAGAGFLLVGVTNQPAAAKGQATAAALDAVQERVVALLAGEGAALDDWRTCRHHPDVTGPCPCRKPAPGMLLDAAAAHDVDLPRSWMVGDSDTDVEAGRAAGCRTVLVDHSGSAHRRAGNARPDARAPDLAAAAELILGDGAQGGL